MKKVFTLLLTGSTFCGFAQHKVLDSLNNLYQHSTTDSAKCYNLILVASEYSNTNTDSSLTMVTEAIDLAKKLRSDILLVKAFDVAGYIFGKKGDYEQAGTYLFDALRLAEKLNCIDCIAYVKNELSERELEIIRLVAEGMSSNEIGKKLFISPRTVDTHRNNILQKLDLPNIASLVSFAYKNKLIK